jgi:RNA polymerase sigma-70 factor (ECF subfamily)
MSSEYLKHVDSVDVSELTVLIDEYGDDIWKYAYYLTKNREQAKDIAQEVFIKAHYKIHTFRGQSTIKTWLLTITRNISLNYLSSSYFRRVRLFGNIKSKQSTSSAETDYISQQSTADVWSIIMKLSDKLREVLVLDLEYDLTIQQSAQLLNLPEGTVKSRLHRARKEVENQLEGWEK